MELHILNSRSVKSFLGFLKGHFSGLVYENLSFVLKEMGDGKRFTSTSTTEVEYQISGFALYIHSGKLAALVLDLELAIHEGFGFKEVNIFGSQYFVAERGIIGFMKPDFELFFHFGDFLVELRLIKFYFVESDFERVDSESEGRPGVHDLEDAESFVFVTDLHCIKQNVRNSLPSLMALVSVMISF